MGFFAGRRHRRVFTLILRCSQSTRIVAATPPFDLAAAESLIRPSPFGRGRRQQVEAVFLCTFGGGMSLGFDENR